MGGNGRPLLLFLLADKVPTFVFFSFAACSSTFLLVLLPVQGANREQKEVEGHECITLSSTYKVRLTVAVRARDDA